MTREEQVQRAKSAMTIVLTKAMVAGAVALFPITMAIPFLGPILEGALGKIAEYAVNKGELGAFAYMIDERVDSQAKTFITAALGLEQAQKSGDKDAIYNAENDFIRAADPFLDLKS